MCENNVQKVEKCVENSVETTEIGINRQKSYPHSPQRALWEMWICVI